MFILKDRGLGIWTSITDFHCSYTDFQVNEVRKDGTVVHLTSFKTSEEKTPKEKPVRPPQSSEDSTLPQAQEKELAQPQQRGKDAAVAAVLKTISDHDTETLNGILGNELANELTKAYYMIQNKRLGPGFRLSLGTFVDKEKRTELHKV